MANLLHFDTSGDQVSVSQSAGFSQGTIEFWMRPTLVTNACGVVYTQGNPATTWSHLLGVVAGKARSYLFDGSAKQIDGTTTLLDNEWVHLALTWQDSGFMRLIVNGVQENQIAIASSFKTGPILLLGRAGASGITGNLVGYLHEFRLWNVARTPTEIAATKNQYLTGTESNLVLLLPLTEGTGTTVFDLAAPATNGTISGAVWDIGDPPFSNNPPTAPTITSPTASQTVTSTPLNVTWDAATDVDSDPIQYEGDYSTDGISWTPLFSLQSETSFSWDLTAIAAGDYHLRVRAHDGSEYGPYDTIQFTIQVIQWIACATPSATTWTEPQAAFIQILQDGQYFTNFAEYGIDTLPNDWTVTEAGDVNYAKVISAPDATGERVFRVDVAPAAVVFEWDSIAEASVTTRVEILMKMRRLLKTDDVFAGPSGGLIVGVFNQSHQFRIGCGAHDRQANDPDDIQAVGAYIPVSQPAGGIFITGAGSNVPWSANSWVWTRSEFVLMPTLQGVLTRSRVWNDGEVEPDIWHISSGPGNDLEPGPIGFGIYSHNTQVSSGLTFDIDVFAVGVNGVSAPSSGNIASGTSWQQCAVPSLTTWSTC